MPSQITGGGGMEGLVLGIQGWLFLHKGKEG